MAPLHSVVVLTRRFSTLVEAELEATRNLVLSQTPVTPTVSLKDVPDELRNGCTLAR